MSDNQLEPLQVETVNLQILLIRPVMTQMTTTTKKEEGCMKMVVVETIARG